MVELAQIVAVLASTLFAGAALYVSLVEHLERWGRLHALRTIVSLAASVLFILA